VAGLSVSFSYFTQDSRACSGCYVTLFFMIFMRLNSRLDSYPSLCPRYKMHQQEREKGESHAPYIPTRNLYFVIKHLLGFVTTKIFFRSTRVEQLSWQAYTRKWQQVDDPILLGIFKGILPGYLISIKQQFQQAKLFSKCCYRCSNTCRFHRVR
jgi:hypothetical protein